LVPEVIADFAALAELLDHPPAVRSDKETGGVLRLLDSLETERGQQ